MKQNTSSYTNSIISISRLLVVVFIQILLENSVQHLFGDNFIRISVSFLFIINLFFFIRFSNFKLFLSLQLIIIFAYAIIMLPHVYFFNIFSFYSRTNYIIYDPLKFITYGLSVLIAAVFLYYSSLFQFNQLSKIINRKYLLLFIMVLFFIKLIIGSYNFSNKEISITIINQNLFQLYLIDYETYKLGGNKIISYQCSDANNLSPTIRFMYNNRTNKELLLIIESWGILKNDSKQKLYINYINNLFFENVNLSKNYNISYSMTCFQGNTSAAEGRELLNMNNEESYRAFLLKNVKPQYNIVRYKNKNNYYTVAGLSASKYYGSSWSNVEGFRRKVGFKSRFFYEDFFTKKNKNKENNYISVNDEVMIDSLFNLSRFHKKIFAYGLTINTHVPFNLDKKNIDIKDYTNFNNKFVKTFDDKLVANDQFYRISTIIKHTFAKISSHKNSFDKVLIIGDHASPELSSHYLFNQNKVPYLLIERK